MKLFLTLILTLSLGFNLFAQTKERSQHWTHFAQEIDVATIKKKVKAKGKIKLRVTGQAKVVTESEASWAGLWVKSEDKNGKRISYDSMGDRKIKSDKWHSYMVELEVDNTANKVFFGGFAMGNGKFYFDDFEVVAQNANGNYQKLSIKNAGFEKKTGTNNMSGWFEGTGTKNKVRAKEFTVSSATDKAQGKYSLLLEGKGITLPNYLIGPIEGYTPHVGTLVTMLNNLTLRIESAVKNMSQKQIDWQEDENSNSIGALIIHLAATEAYYQVATFEDREFNKEETLKWAAASGLGKKGRNVFKGKNIDYYLNVCKEVRKKTLEKLKGLDDAWLTEKHNDGQMNNHFAWFHVMEHQANHLGQIYMIRKKMKQQKIK